MAPRLPRIFLTLLLALAACAAPGSPRTGASPAISPQPAPTPLTLTDDAGRAVEIPTRTARIVSLAPSNTEIVCALHACDRVVGVTDFDDYPPEVKDRAKVVIGAQVDVEKVVAADPDLVLAAGNELTPTKVIEQLTRLGYPVLTLYPQSLDEVYADIALVGRAIGETDPATALIAQMRARVDSVTKAVAGAERPRTFYEVSVFEGVIYTAGTGSFLASLVDLAGGEPITGDARSTSIALEKLVSADPQVIVLGDSSYDPSITPASVAARPGWGKMTAVLAGHVLPYSHDGVTTRPGPRIVDGLEALARLLHPESFD
ncbi:MAG: ABC transporter substrate-binding protein [Chloroflexota bacterium]